MKSRACLYIARSVNVDHVLTYHHNDVLGTEQEKGKKKTEHRLQPISECICICVDRFVWFFRRAALCKQTPLTSLRQRSSATTFCLRSSQICTCQVTGTTRVKPTRKMHANPGQLSALFMQPGAGSPEGSKVWFTIAKILLL